ncbi:MAG: hypothetical protein M1821_003371 [Bathelium mastoideum]|nr:MAG: hypothetical protein M1821_003371 [Bathelium mastoideum]
MSTTSNPITPARFAAALPALPLSALHAKAAELRNALSHLASSNAQLADFAAAGDADCADALRENGEVARRMEERIALLRAEVQARGMPWPEDEDEEAVNGKVVNGDGNGVREDNEGAQGAQRDEGVVGGGGGGAGGGQEDERRGGERRGLSDEELQLRLRERLGEPDEDEGVHL